MKKVAIVMVLALVAVIVIAACSESTGAPAYVEPAMEGFTVAETTSELIIESALQTAESESAAQTEAATSSSAGTTTTATTTSTARPVTAATQAVTAKATTAKATTAAPTTARPTTAATTTAATTRYVPPATTTALYIDRGAQDIVPMDMAYLNEVVATLNRIRAERGLAPMVMKPDLMASSLAHAKKMAEAGTSFHSDPPPGCESVGYVPYHVFTAQMLGEDLTTHVANFTQAEFLSVGIAVVKRGDYLYAVMQGNL